MYWARKCGISESPSLAGSHSLAEEQRFCRAPVYAFVFDALAYNIHGIVVAYALNDSLVILVLRAVDSINPFATDG